MVDDFHIETLPVSPGVYLMKGERGEILYVGKAKNIRKRVRSYFGKGGESRYHIQFLVTKVKSIDCIVTDTEKEALILENTLIKQHHPRYNLDLRDDKTYFSLRIDLNEAFPQISIIRKVIQDGARYFGPYSSASAAREVLKQLYRLFPLRHYPLATCRQRKRPCLFYQLRQCSAPCHGLISRDDYQALAEGAALFLEGKNHDLLKIYRQRMNSAAAEERYEEAGRFRDLIHAIEVTVEKQKMVTRSNEDTDVVGYFRHGAYSSIALLFIRGGRLNGNRNFTFAWEMDDNECLSSFLTDYYQRDVVIPGEVLLPMPNDDLSALTELVTERRRRKTKFVYPRRGTKVELVKLAIKNAESALQKELDRVASTETVLAELQDRLHLRNVPHRIECYDISTIQGTFAVGSRVSFFNGKADKSGYRRYRIRTVHGSDDFAMMREVLSRRFSRDMTENNTPDLILIDGGIGQLNAVTAALDELGIKGIDTVSLAKSRVEREMTGEEIQRSNERVFLPGRKNPVVLRQNSRPLLLLAQIRDEAHRFAITYHKQLRQKETLHSLLDNIAGVGSKRRRELLKRFGSLAGLRKARREELMAASFLPANVVENIWQALHPDENSGSPEREAAADTITERPSAKARPEAS